MPTFHGGVAIIDGGGNTGSTAKAPFVSQTAIRFTQSLDRADAEPGSVNLKEMESHYEQIRVSLRRTSEDLPPSEWQRLEDELNDALNAAQFTAFAGVI